MTRERTPDLESAVVLVVDDDASNVESLRKILEKEGAEVFAASRAAEALEVCRQHRIHVVVSDLMMPGASGLELLKALTNVSPDSECVLMTAYGTIETAVSAMRAGAYDFVEKPLRRINIVKTVRKAAERFRILEENRSLRQELQVLTNRTIIGTSPAIRHALDVAAQAAPSTANVLILGASGTGKELLARYIHERSGRAGPFVPVNLGALPETIVEAELFGHERGAFTGATQQRAGRFAKAHNGTLFIDEIGELTPAVQVKLLRVLQEGEFEPLGGQTTRAAFRLVAATNRDLKEAVDEGDFREDLYYRLHVIPITCPRLADRRSDVSLLTEHFLEHYAAKNNKPRMVVSEQAMDRLVRYDWPGNVRELENAVERAVVLGRKASLELEDLPRAIVEAEDSAETLPFDIGTTLAEVERRMIRATLDHTGGDKQLAAQLLGISARTIYRKLG